MEDGGAVSSGKQQGASYTYWVREVTQEAAPFPVPRKITPEDLSYQPRPATLGSVWNREAAGNRTLIEEAIIAPMGMAAGTWEEKNLNKWASDRIKELIRSVGFLEFSDGKAEITNVPKCIGDAFLVTVRNKKRVGYTYELSLTIKGEWKLKEDKKVVEAHIDIPEFSFGELDDLQMEVRIIQEKDLLPHDKSQINRDLKLFLKPVREMLLQFEEELKDR